MTAPAEAQRRVNSRLWARAERLLPLYANRTLRPAEVMLLVHYRDDLTGRVLEIGCGAGRLTGYLAALGEEVYGVDISAAMVEHCRRTYPDARFDVADLHDLSGFGDAAFDAIWASYNILDILDDAQRRATFRELKRMLTPGGLLIFSSHNRASQVRSPTDVRAHHPARMLVNLALAPRRLRNHRRIVPHQTIAPDYAILNDEAHEFSSLHYYIAPEAQSRQLAEVGFELLRAVDLEGNTLQAGESAPGSGEIHYAARPAGG